jgi:hypothetical protein
MPWVKGQSGNPGGRSKGVKEVQDLARRYTTDAIQTLADICSNPEATPSARVSAAEVLLDRGWGKAAQKIELEGINQLPEHVIDTLLAAFDAIEAEGLAATGAPGDGGLAATAKVNTAH